MNRRAARVAALYAALFLTAAALFFLLSRGAVHFVCPFREITGLRCPGCGNTNALLAAARGEFYEAFMCNPMFFPEAALAAAGVICLSALYIKNTRPSKAAAAVFIVGAALILLWGIVRNIFNL